MWSCDGNEQYKLGLGRYAYLPIQYYLDTCVPIQYIAMM